MSFIEIVNKVTSLADQETIEDENLKSKHGLELGISRGDPASEAYLAEARAKPSVLKNYLSTLSPEVLAKLETVMYFGRDPGDVHGNDIGEYHARLHDGALVKDDIIRNLTDKTPALKHYFNEAKRKSETLSLDLEANP